MTWRGSCSSSETQFCKNQLIHALRSRVCFSFSLSCAAPHSFTLPSSCHCASSILRVSAPYLFKGRKSMQISSSGFQCVAPREDSACGGHSFTAAPPITFFPLLQDRCMYTVTERTQFTATAAWLSLQFLFLNKGTYLHLSFQGRKSDSSKDARNASTVCSLSNVIWMLFVVAGIRHKCWGSRCLRLLLLTV